MKPLLESNHFQQFNGLSLIYVGEFNQSYEHIQIWEILKDLWQSAHNQKANGLRGVVKRVESLAG